MKSSIKWFENIFWLYIRVFVKFLVRSECWQSWHSTLSICLLSTNCCVFLGQIVEWFPNTFSMLWNSEIFLLWDWLLFKARELNVPCYLTHKWEAENRQIHAYLKSICMKVNTGGDAGIWTWHTKIHCIVHTSLSIETV